MRQYHIAPGPGGGVRPYEVQCVLEGGCWPSLEGEKLMPPPAPSLWFFPLGSDHTWLDHPERISRILVGHFSELPSPMEKALADRTHLCRRLSDRDRDRARIIFGELASHYRSPSELSGLTVEKCLLELVIVALRRDNSSERRSRETVDRIKTQQAIDWYRLHLPEGPTVEDVAKGVYTNAIHLRRLFRKTTGSSPHEAFHAIRMERAEQELRSSNKPSNQVAIELGFSEPSAFSRAFRQHCGRSPQAFRADVLSE